MNLNEIFIDGKTEFILSSDEQETHHLIFQDVICNLIKTIKYMEGIWYLIETKQDFTGLDFGIGAVRINKFFIKIRHAGNFEKNKKNDVLVYLPNDIDNPTDIKKNVKEMKVIDWAYIYNIK